MFSRDDIRSLMNEYVLVQLYTDGIPAAYRNQPATPPEESRNLLLDRFGTGALPYYVIVQPTPDGFEKVASYGDKGNGLITDVPDFARWLKDHVK